MKKPDWLIKLARKLDWAERELELKNTEQRVDDFVQQAVRLRIGLDDVAKQMVRMQEQRNVARHQRDEARRLVVALQNELDRYKFAFANATPLNSSIVLDQSGHPYREVTVEIIREVPEFITRLHAEIRLSNKVIVMLGSKAWEDGINQLGETVKRLLTEKHNELVESYRQATHLGPPGQSS